MDKIDPHSDLNNNDLPKKLKKKNLTDVDHNEDSLSQSPVTRSQTREEAPVVTRTRNYDSSNAYALALTKGTTMWKEIFLGPSDVEKFSNVSKSNMFLPNFSINFCNMDESMDFLTPDNENIYHSTVTTKGMKDWKQ